MLNVDILKEIKENSKKLDSCKKHFFEQGRVVPVGNKYTCSNCGGLMKGESVMYYIHGYEARGGDCNDIYPGWNG